MTSAAPTTAESKTSAVPPRWSLLKRLLLIALSLGVLLAVLWAFWDRAAQRRLGARLGELHGRGERIYRTDFLPPALPDEQNAAVLLKAAGAAVPDDPACPEASDVVFPTYPPFPPQWQKMVDAAMVANAKPLRLARQARALNRAVWQQIPPSPVMTNQQWNMNINAPQRALVMVLADAAMDAHLKGDDAEAIERLRDIFHVADTLDAQNYSLVTRLISVGIEALALVRLEVICTDNLRTESASATTPGLAKPVRRQVVRDLIGYLLDDSRDRAADIDSLEGERMLELDEMQVAADRGPLLRPMLRLDEIHLIDNSEIALRAARQPSWPAAVATLAALPPRPKTGSVPVGQRPRYSHMFSDMVMSILMPDLFLQTGFRVHSERYAAATLLALRMYYEDHHHWPAGLDELVPEYLPAVPIDVFRADKRPIGFTIIRDAAVSREPRPLIFFGTTNAATAPTPPASPAVGWGNHGPMQWRDVTRWTPVASAPSE